LGISTAVVPTGDLNMHINRDNQEKQPNLNGLLEKKTRIYARPSPHQVEDEEAVVLPG
jgi:hypothetical protein